MCATRKCVTKYLIRREMKLVNCTIIRRFENVNRKLCMNERNGKVFMHN